MPRPSKLGPYRIVAFAIEIDKYQMLREIAFNKGKTLSELLRDIVDDYLEQQGLMNAEVVAADGGLKTLSLIEQKLLVSELNVIMQDLERLSRYIPTLRKGTIDWHDAIEKMRCKIRKALSIIQKIGIPSDGTLRKLKHYSDFLEEMTGTKERLKNQ